VGKSEKKMGRVHPSVKRRGAIGAPVTTRPPNAIQPKTFTARVEWTEVHRCYEDIKAVNATELEKQVADLMAKIPRIPECYPPSGYGSRYKLKLYYTRTSSLSVRDIKRCSTPNGEVK
jgi:hypothetical protein